LAIPPPPAFRVTLSAPVVEVTLALVLKVIWLVALSVSVAAPPAVFAMALATVMLPASVPTPAVLIVTFVPPFREV